MTTEVETAIYQVLISSSEVMSLVQAGINPPRIYQQRKAANAPLPALSYQLVSDPSESSHDGPAGLARARVQFDCWGITPAQASAVARAVRVTLAGIHRASSGMVLSGGIKANEMTLDDPDPKLKRRVLDMLIWHSEDQ